MDLPGTRMRAAALIPALGLLLGGCDQARFTADLATDPPADFTISSVQVNLLGLQFRKQDGSTTTLEFTDGEQVDLLDLVNQDPLRLFTDEELPAGDYTGVRLLFDDDQDDSAVATDDGDFPLLIGTASYAAVDFTVVEDEESRETLTLALDLRQTLSFDGTDEEYTLTPDLRSVRTEDAAQIAGDVDVVCPGEPPLTLGRSVYLFSGADVQPDDLDRLGAEPVATTSVVDSTTAGLRYALRFLESGDYTLALTCLGDEDVLDANDDLDFRNVRNVQVDDGELLERDLN